MGAAGSPGELGGSGPHPHSPKRPAQGTHPYDTETILLHPGIEPTTIRRLTECSTDTLRRSASLDLGGAQRLRATFFCGPHLLATKSNSCASDWSRRLRATFFCGPQPARTARIKGKRSGMGHKKKVARNPRLQSEAQPFDFVARKCGPQKKVARNL